MARIVWVCAVASASVCERVAREKSPKRSRSITVRQTRRAARSRRASLSTSATTVASSAGVRLRACGRARAARPSSAGGGASARGRGSRLCASACRCRPDARPSMLHRGRPPPARATWPTVVQPALVELLGGDPARLPRAARPGAGAGTSSSPSGGTTSSPSGLATPLATLARNLVLATPTVIGSPTRSSTRRRSRAAISTGVPAIRSHPADVEERLVDRQPLDERRRVLEHLEHRLARLRVGRHARRRPRPRPGRAAAPARRPSPSGRRAPWPRSWPPARRPPPTITGRPRSEGRRAARPTRRKHPGRRA